MKPIFFPAVISAATPALASDNETVTREVWGIAVIAITFIVLAFIGSRR